jgi:predicted nuclease of predicted toxin-antitoxin system
MIRLLLDANLSWRSADVLKAHFDDCLHVDSTGLPVPAKDSEIWRYAESNDMIIVTNDEDFMELQVTSGFPPKVVWIKTGNQTRKYVERLLIKLKDEITALYHSNEYGLLEIINPKSE